MKTIAFIPVRGGSRSIPLKNIKPLAGRPLVHWTINAALGCQDIDLVVLCTDNEKIRAACDIYAGNSRFTFAKRSRSVSTDTASTESVMIEYATSHDNFEVMILIQATSPLLKSEDLKKGMELFLRPDYDSVLSVVKQKRFIWEDQEGYGRPLNYDYRHRPRRQEFSGFLVENGAFYITRRDDLFRSQCRISGRIGLYEMNEKTYYEIDECEDWAIVEHLIK